MATTFEKVREFHEKFGHPVNEKPVDLATLDPKLIRLRMDLIAEEFFELVEATFSAKASETMKNAWDNVFDDHDDEDTESGVWNLDPIEIPDALGDLDYVISGFAHVAGIPHDKVVDEIHSSNMSKLGEDGEPILRSDGKILKGPDYFRPDIARVLDEKE